MNTRLSLLFCFCLLVAFVLPATNATATVKPTVDPLPLELVSLDQTTVQAQETTAAPLPEKDDRRWRMWQSLPADVQAKVDPRILAELRGEMVPAYLGGDPVQQPLRPVDRIPLAQTRFLVYLQQQANFTALAETVFASAAQQRSAVFALLTAQAQQEQAAVRGWLDSRLGTAIVGGYQPFTIVNAIAVDGSLESIIDLAQRADVARLVANYPLVKQGQGSSSSAASLDPFAAPRLQGIADAVDAPLAPSVIELDADNWNIELVRADRVWNELLVRGEGAVVADFDTGVAFRHPALVKQYRGNLQNGKFEHNYNWFEPDGRLYPNGNLGASLTSQPHDCDTHGTHTMGTMVGDGGLSGTQVGMAPGAKWIAIPGICSGTMSGGIGDDIGGLKAFQWLLCPTDLSGNLQSADCSKAPDVVNNSWGSANPTNDVLRPAIQALRAMNIAPVFAAGNPRAGAGSIGTPANAPEAITVGATDNTDRVAPFSGRGPSFYEGEQKPELSAPGVNVKSTVVGNSYEAFSGTSMAAPHVSGLIALMVSADLRDRVRDFTIDELETFMTRTAVDLGPTGTDNDYGYGRIDAYEAVRWVLSAGDLRGAVRNQVDNTPIAQAKVTGNGVNASFYGVSNGAGLYSVTVPANSYALTVAAWGYYSRTFANQTVFAGALALADFALRPLPIASLQGVVNKDGAPVVNALIYSEEKPDVRIRTDGNGHYAFTLPIGRHTLVVKEPGYRIQRTIITVTEAGVTQDLTVEGAPSILLVEADAYRGWFEGWPIGNIFTWALDKQGYAYDRWRIQSVKITDTATLEDGSLAYGVPSTTTLQGYDVVIWAQSGCDSGFFGCLYRSSPVTLGADDSLQGYLDTGGRLILSGQDIGTWDEGTRFFDEYLNANQLLENAAGEGDTLSGGGFLQSLALTLTNASLYGYRNGSIDLSPDAISAESNAVATYPILRYDESGSPAALAVDPCNANYRAVYFGVGFENIGPRADNRDPAIAEVLGRAVRWVSDAKAQSGFELFADQTNANVEPGQSITYKVQLINSGRVALTLQVASNNTSWPTRILLDGQEVTQPLTLAPCQTLPLTVVVATPFTALNGEQATTVLTSTNLNDPTQSRQVTFKTVAFAAWQVEKALPTSRYRLGVVAPPNDSRLFTIGGWRNDIAENSSTPTERASTALEQYNVCTRRWESLAALPGPRANSGVALVNGKIYVVGGNSFTYSLDLYDYRYYATVFAYDLAGNLWTEVASLPKAYTSMAVAAANGKLYAFGGIDEESNISAKSYEYDPATNAWTEKAPMPGGPRYLAAAATLDNQIYVVGGWEEADDVEIYNLASNSWQVGPALQQGRHSLGLTAAPDGYLYAVGGAVNYLGEGSVERYSPAANGWELLSRLNDPQRFGTAAAYVGGRIYTVGGAEVHESVEALPIDTAFCLSEQSTPQSAVGIGTPISYTVALYADTQARPNASYLHPLPPKTSFGGFTENVIGARFNPATQQIEWHGALEARGAPKALGYLLTTDTAGLANGDQITSTAHFNNGAGVAFTRTTVSLVLASDLSGSTKSVDRADALAGEPLTYTIQLRGATFVGGEVSVRDPLPATVAYLPDTLTYSSGSGSYDPATHSIVWSGRTQAGPDAYLNFREDYVWGDSDGNGVLPAPYAWIEIGETGASVEGGDATYSCDLPVGFVFPFYGVMESSFCVSSNGFLSFQRDGVADDINDCPLPTSYGNEAVIAALWDDLIVMGDIRYQTLGVAPNRYLVVQWNDVRRYGAINSKLATFQVVLFENGVIRVATDDLGGMRGATSTTGIEDYSATDGLTYACNTVGTLHDQQSIVFVPPGASTGATRADIRFQVRSTTNLGVNEPLTNTVAITTPTASFQRQAATLMNPVSLHSSALQADRSEVAPNESIVYRATLLNTGLFTATNAGLTLSVPAAMSYVEGTVSCTNGLCQHDAGVIRWSGVLAPQQATTVIFTLRLTTGLPDRTPIVLVGQVDDGFGNHYELAITVLARRSDLRPSQLQLVPAYVGPGDTVGVNVVVYNEGGLQTNSSFQLTIPAGLDYIADSLACGVGVCTYADGVIQWSGSIGARTVVPLNFRLQVPADANYGDVYTITATVNDIDWNESYPLTATLTIAHNTYLSIIHGSAKAFQQFLPFAGE